MNGFSLMKKWKLDFSKLWTKNGFRSAKNRVSAYAKKARQNSTREPFLELTEQIEILFGDEM